MISLLVTGIIRLILLLKALIDLRFLIPRSLVPASCLVQVLIGLLSRFILILIVILMVEFLTGIIVAVHFFSLHLDRT